MYWILENGCIWISYLRWSWRLNKRGRWLRHWILWNGLRCSGSVCWSVAVTTNWRCGVSGDYDWGGGVGHEHIQQFLRCVLHSWRQFCGLQGGECARADGHRGVSVGGLHEGGGQMSRSTVGEVGGGARHCPPWEDWMAGWLPVDN